MSIEYLTIKSNCVIWKNIQLPHPNYSLQSPVFPLKGLNWHFNVACTWTNNNSHSNTFGLSIQEEEHWRISTECPNGAGLYNVIPYVETSPGIYILITMEPYRGLFTARGICRDVITLLFLFEPHSLRIPLDFKETSITATEGNASDDEPIQYQCLEGLAKDIGQLFNEKEYSDAILKCGDKSFAVHRNILLARSDVFSAMFKHDMAEKNSGVVKIVDLDPNILEQFLRYLYSGCVEEMSMDIVFELYKAADKYNVLTLKKLCASYIFDNISADIIPKVLLLADEAGDVEFLNRVAYFAAKTEGFLKSAEWKEFAEKFPSIAIKVFFKYHN